MFGIFSKKKKPKNALDQLIFTMYGNPPPESGRADLQEAIKLASEDLLNRKINKELVVKQAEALHAGPMPYSTYDLALSVALYFLKDPANVEKLFQEQLMARMTMLDWFGDGLVNAMLVKSMEDTLYKLYK